MRKKKNNLSHETILYILIMLLSSCSGLKHLGDGERYYTGAEIKFRTEQSIKGKDKLQLDMDKLLAVQPNAKILGSRPGVYFYHLIKGEPKESQGFKRFVKYKLGDEPVLQEDIDPDRTSNRLADYLKNQGFFNAEVEYEVKEKEHEASVTYNIFPHQPYHLRKIIYPEVDSVYQNIIAEIQHETLLDSGMRYSLEVLKEEQQRIENMVEDEGFFYFDDNYIIYRADSAVGDHQVDLTFTLDKNTPQRAKTRFTMDTISIYPDYSVIKDTTSNQKKRVSFYKKHSFINDTDYMRKDILTEAIILEPDSTYSQIAETYTLEHLLNLGTFKYVNIKFDQSDSARLSSSIYMTPFPKKSISFKVEGITKSNNFAGPAIGITFSNRNTFKGGELLELSLNGSYNWQIGGEPATSLSAYEVGVESSLTFPRILSPVDIINYHNWRYLPSTQLRLGVRLQERVNLFRLNSFNAGYGFLWRTTIAKSHEFFPININYVQLGNESPEFQEMRAKNPALLRSIQDQYIIGGTYSYTYNSKAKEDSDDKLNHYFFNASTDVSGNLVKATQAIIRGEAIGENSDYEIFNRSYSQYAKQQLDFRYYRSLSATSELASRLLVGVARAYGNADQVPFIKQFSAGGTNDIRAFQARSLGPGSYFAKDDTRRTSSDKVVFLDETGDIKLLANLEYRTKLVSVVNGAVFLDAGNIWLWEEGNKEGGEFKFNSFFQEIALGGGVGVRFDFSFFILRFDLATPLYNPRFALGERWVFNTSEENKWSTEDLLLNIGIGYPF